MSAQNFHLDDQEIAAEFQIFEEGLAVAGIIFGRKMRQLLL